MHNRSQHPSLLPLSGGINFRDQGGLPVKDGRRIKKGLLLRSGALNSLTPQDQQYLSDNAVKHIIDYRDTGEVKDKPDNVWPGANYQHIPANPTQTPVTANLESMDKSTIEQFDPLAFMLELYRYLPFDNSAYHYLFKIMLTVNSGGLVQHCAIGKDRTGVGSAMALFALGASYETVMDDYLLTQQTLAPFRQHMLSRMAEKIDEKAVKRFEFVLAAQADFLDTALNEVNHRYGSIDRWLLLEYGINDEKKLFLQNKYLQD